MNNFKKKWLYLALLSFIWGSSFILIKKGLVGFSSLQVGGLRIIFASLFLFVFGIKSLKNISLRDWKWISIAGFLSSFFPPFFFAIAQTEIDSGITSILNSIVPLATTLVGVWLFGLAINKRQILGVFIGLLGTIALVVVGLEFSPNQNYWYSIFIFLSALGYAFNINIIKRHLAHLTPLQVTTGSFGVVIIPAIIMLAYGGILEVNYKSIEIQKALGYILVLAILGTAVANILFNKLIHISSPVFSASVTYIIPLVAILWGILDGETINLYQIVGGVIILFGVWLVNKKKHPTKKH
ncbi:EamA family transporter [uncultured Maribacter sp.]|uniref:DMT family transporter n=1 Tax=uncultured Maribacter sp. TaxID=431308 RepID=UPI00261BE6E6|nr:EamA family transporter [uncultured Maribacter sp.]